MKVKEMIAALQKFDGELEVVGGTGVFTNGIIDARYIGRSLDRDGKTVCVVEFSGNFCELGDAVDSHPLSEINITCPQCGSGPYTTEASWENHQNNHAYADKLDECAKGNCHHVKK